MAIGLLAAGSAYIQNFDTLSNTTGSTTNDLLNIGWALIETGGGALANNLYAVGNGSSNTGDTYSFGTSSSTERALGSLQSGTVIPVFGANFVNSTGVTLTSLLLNYIGEQWRLGARAALTGLISSTASTQSALAREHGWMSMRSTSPRLHDNRRRCGRQQRRQPHRDFTCHRRTIHRRRRAILDPLEQLRCGCCRRWSCCR